METTELVKNKFFTFDQNNSGGYFVEDETHGVCETVIIEAPNAEFAIEKLNVIGKEVKGFHSFCSCCGERWSKWLDDSDADDVPSIYGKPIEGCTKGMFRDKAYVHYMDGSFKKFILS